VHMGCGVSAQKLSPVPKPNVEPNCNPGDEPVAFDPEQPADEPEPEDDSGPRTIVLVGVTGDGKSSTGNSLVGESAFQVSGGLCSEAAVAKAADYIHVSDNELEEYRCIDTIGLHDTGLPATEVLRRFNTFGDLCPLGIDVFLFVVRWGRFKPDHEAAFDSFLANCGEDALRHTLLVFTHCSLTQAELSSQLATHAPPGLGRLLPALGGAPVGIDNIQDSKGAREVLRKAVAASSGGARYSNAALKEARARHDIGKEEERAAFSAAVADWRKGGAGPITIEREYTHIDSSDQVLPFEQDE